MLFLIVVSRHCTFRPATSLPGSHFNRATNAAWLDIDWVNEPKTQPEIVALANALHRRQIRDAYVYVSYLKDHGRFNPTYAHAAAFTRAFKAAQPEINVQAWLGLPLNHPWLFSTGGYVDLGDAATRQYVATFSADLIRQGGFDGVHLDPEPIPSDDADVLVLLDAVRQAIGPDVILSISTRHIQPVFSDTRLPWIGQFLWRASYYREIARRVDQVALMTYDSHLPLPQLYRLWTRFQVIALTRALEGVEVDVFIGVPTSEEVTASHVPRAENMASGLQGTIDGLNDAASRPQVVTGVGIYPHWETDEAEWAVYESVWLGR